MIYEVYESDQFIRNVEDAAVWILTRNMDRTVAFAEAQADRLQTENENLKNNLSQYPDLGRASAVERVLQFPVYDGRFLVAWIVEHSRKRVTLLSLADLKYPKELRQFYFDDSS